MENEEEKDEEEEEKVRKQFIVCYGSRERDGNDFEQNPRTGDEWGRGGAGKEDEKGSENDQIDTAGRRQLADMSEKRRVRDQDERGGKQGEVSGRPQGKETYLFRTNNRRHSED